MAKRIEFEITDSMLEDVDSDVAGAAKATREELAQEVVRRNNPPTAEEQIRRIENGWAEQRVTNPKWLRKGIEEYYEALRLDATTGRNDPPPVLDVDYPIGS